MERRKNVYELVQERLDMIFKEFDNIYVSFSGGKDSGVLLNLCIDYIRKHNLKRKIGVFHLDYEIQYRMTLDYVGRTFGRNRDIMDVYHVCVPFRVTTCTSPCIRISGVPGMDIDRTAGYVPFPGVRWRLKISSSTIPACGTMTFRWNFPDGYTWGNTPGVPAVLWVYVPRKAITAGVPFIKG